VIVVLNFAPPDSVLKIRISTHNPKKYPLDFAFSFTAPTLMNRILDNLVPLLFPVLFSVCTICRLLLWGWPNAPCNSLVVWPKTRKPTNEPT